MIFFEHPDIRMMAISLGLLAFTILGIVFDGAWLLVDHYLDKRRKKSGK